MTKPPDITYAWDWEAGAWLAHSTSPNIPPRAVDAPPRDWFVRYDPQGNRWVDRADRTHPVGTPGVPPKPDDPTLGMKFDLGKPLPRLLPVGPLMAIVDVLTYGATKYAPDNWKHVDDARDRYADALLRHVLAWLGGESHDAESGLRHLAHAGCCILFLLHFELSHGN